MIPPAQAPARYSAGLSLAFGGAMFLVLLLIGFLGGGRSWGAWAGVVFWSAVCAWTAYGIIHSGRFHPYRFWLFLLLALGTLLSVFVAPSRPMTEWSAAAPSLLGPAAPVCHIALAGDLVSLGGHAFQAWFNPANAGLGFYYLLGISYLLFTLLLGTGWCGWACGYGAWDETASRLGARRPRWRLPGNPRLWAAASGGLLLAVVLLAFMHRELIFCEWLCPFKLTEPLGGAALEHRTLQLSVLAVVGLVFILALPALTGKRTFCLLICPFGAWQRWVGRINPFAILCSPEACNQCGACSRVCPLGAIRTAEGTVVALEVQCVRCGRCLDACPSGALRLAWRGRSDAGGGFSVRLAFILTAVLLAGVAGAAVWGQAGARIGRLLIGGGT
jgi:ferredoxin-type protein NapH